MNTNEVAMLTAFMYAGALQQNVSGLAFEKWGGHVGFVQSCAEYAQFISAWISLQEDDVHPGVMYYELIEPLGEWLIQGAKQAPKDVLEQFKIEYLAWIDKQ